jgi:hypothetical protein
VATGGGGAAMVRGCFGEIDHGSKKKAPKDMDIKCSAKLGAFGQQPVLKTQSKHHALLRMAKT